MYLQIVKVLCLLKLLTIKFFSVNPSQYEINKKIVINPLSPKHDI